MKILSVGSFSGLSNTCLHRNWALKQIASHVDEINTSANKCSLWHRIAYHLFLYGLPIRQPQNNNENEKIKYYVDKNKYDLVWIDKGTSIYPETLCYIKKKWPHIIIVSYSPDNMALRHNQSQQYLQCIPLYDYIITNKSYIQDDMKRLGAKEVLFVNNSYETAFHYPRILSEGDYIRLGADVGFVGAWEKERCESILYLVDHGIRVRVFGNGKWNKYIGYSPNLQIDSYGLYNEDYAKSFKAFKISLCFLRKINFDQQTTRSVEIPACGGFMLAERTTEHLKMFQEGKEAEYFSSNEELLHKCRYYLDHDSERFKIAKAGLERCISSDYSNLGMVKKCINNIFSKR